MQLSNLYDLQEILRSGKIHFLKSLIDERRKSAIQRKIDLSLKITNKQQLGEFYDTMLEINGQIKAYEVLLKHFMPEYVDNLIEQAEEKLTEKVK